VSNGVHTALLIQMRAAEEREYAGAVSIDAAKTTGVTLHRRGSESGQIGDRELSGGGAEEFSSRHPAGAEDHRNVVVLDIRQTSQRRRSLLRGFIRCLGGFVAGLVCHRGNLLVGVSAHGVQPTRGLGNGSRQARVDG